METDRQRKGAGRGRRLAWAMGLSVGGALSLRAEPIPVPNASFESPATSFVNVNLDSWQKAAKPPWYEEAGGFLWDQLVGLFKNTPPTSADHIVNCDGNQGLWLFAVPEVALFVDYDARDWNDAEPSHEFAARFEPGHAYRLTVGVLGGGGNMAEGVVLEIGLYYRDAASNQVMVATTTVTNSAALFTGPKQFLDFPTRVPPVPREAPWAGQHLGLRFLSLANLENQGGYWDLDHVRLERFAPPVLESPSLQDGAFAATVRSEPGQVIEILGSSLVHLAPPQWISLTTITNATGREVFVDPAPPPEGRFYAARLAP